MENITTKENGMNFTTTESGDLKATAGPRTYRVITERYDSRPDVFVLMIHERGEYVGASTHESADEAMTSARYDLNECISNESEAREERRVGDGTW